MFKLWKLTEVQKNQAKICCHADEHTLISLSALQAFGTSNVFSFSFSCHRCLCFFIVRCDSLSAAARLQLKPASRTSHWPSQLSPHQLNTASSVGHKHRYQASVQCSHGPRPKRLHRCLGTHAGYQFLHSPALWERLLPASMNSAGNCCSISYRHRS